jgi:hypothetical protein
MTLGHSSRISLVLTLLLTASAGLAFGACGGSVTGVNGSSDGSSGSSGSSGSQQNGGSDSGTNTNTSGGSSGGSSGGTLAAACPSAAPAQGSSCTPSGLSCEYGGEGPYLECATLAKCGTDGTWAVDAPDPSCKGLQSENDPACPASYTALATGSACPAADVSCVYPEGLCGCAGCFSQDAGGQVKAWACVAFPTPTACPTPRPRIGSSCSVEGQECEYATVCTPLGTGLPNVKCVSGLWQSAQIIEPPCAFPQCGP